MRNLLWVIGSINLDQVITLPHLPAPGETLSGTLAYHYGGKGANQAVAAARAGQSVAMIGAVGDDPAGADMLANLQQCGVDTDRVVAIANHPSGVAQIWVDTNGENSIALAPGANYAVSLWPTATRLPTHALLQSELPPAFLEQAITALAAAGVSITWNNAPAVTLSQEVCGMIETLIVNQVEARMMLDGAAGPADELAAQLAHRYGLKTVCLTLGAAGALAWHAGEVWRQPAFAVNPVDTTGAGDVFAGYWVAAHMNGLPLAQRLGQACAAAALSTTVAGAQPSIPSLGDVLGFMGKNEPLTMS